jgi:hypothetical protein
MQVMSLKNITLFLVLTANTWASDHLLFIGAGGEPAKLDTIFDNTIKKIGEFTSQNPSLKVDVALNGGVHAVTKTIIDNAFPNATTKSDFRVADYNRLIASYIAKLQNNEMLPNEQLMIFIDTHGASSDDKSTTHKVSTSDESGEAFVNLDELKKLQILAKEKKVKMAIIDMSCHSGSTLNLADDNTCVISSTGPNHYGYALSSENFASKMKKGKNLEEIFLEARAQDSSSGLPMISTAAGVESNAALYEKITPYLYSFDYRHPEKLTQFLEENSSVEKQCKADRDFESLIKIINSIEDFNTVTHKILWWTYTSKKVEFANFKNLLSKYKNSQDLVREKFRELSLERLKKVENFSIRNEDNEYITTYNKDYTWKELLAIDFERAIREQQASIENESSPAEKASKKAVLDAYLKASDKKNQILNSNPDLLNIKQRELEIKEMIQSNEETTQAIAVEERKLYSELYKNAKPAKQLNACQNFKL